MQIDERWMAMILRRIAGRLRWTTDMKVALEAEADYLYPNVAERKPREWRVGLDGNGALWDSRHIRDSDEIIKVREVLDEN